MILAQVRAAAPVRFLRAIVAQFCRVAFDFCAARCAAYIVSCCARITQHGALLCKLRLCQKGCVFDVASSELFCWLRPDSVFVPAARLSRPV